MLLFQFMRTNSSLYLDYFFSFLFLLLLLVHIGKDWHSFFGVLALRYFDVET